MRVTKTLTQLFHSYGWNTDSWLDILGTQVLWEGDRRVRLILTKTNS